MSKTRPPRKVRNFLQSLLRIPPKAKTVLRARMQCPMVIQSLVQQRSPSKHGSRFQDLNSTFSTTWVPLQRLQGIRRVNIQVFRCCNWPSTRARLSFECKSSGEFSRCNFLKVRQSFMFARYLSHAIRNFTRFGWADRLSTLPTFPRIRWIASKLFLPMTHGRK